MRNIRKTALLTVLALALCGCGSAYSGAAESSVAFNAKEAAEEVMYEEDAYTGAMAYEEKAAAQKEGSAEPAEFEGNGTAGSEGTDEGIDPAESAQKLIYRCDLTLQTLTFDETMKSIREKIRENGGIVESESTSDNDSGWYYYESSSYRKTHGTLVTYITVRIPTGKYEAFLSALEGTGGKITNRSMNVENITRVYNDQTVLIKSLETQEQRLLDMMDQAETVEDMIVVEERLTDVQRQLNQAKTRLSQMDTDVAYSTVSMRVEEVVRYEEPKHQTTFGERTRNTFEDSIDAFLNFLEGLFHVIIYLLPYLIIAGVILAVVLGLTRKSRAEKREIRKARKEELKRQKAERKAAYEAGKLRRKEQIPPQGQASGSGYTDQSGYGKGPDEQ